MNDRGCKGEVPAHLIIDFIIANPGCDTRAIHANFSSTGRDSFRKRISRMVQRGEIERRYLAQGRQVYYPILREYVPIKTLHLVREIVSVFDYA